MKNSTSFIHVSYEFKESAKGTRTMAMIMFLIVVVGTFGNGMIAITYLQSPKLRKKFLLTIALALLSSCGSLFYLLDIYHLYYRDVMKDPICTIHAYVISTLCVGAIHQLTVLTLERYIGVMYPFVSMKLPMRTKILVSAIAFLWTLVTTTPPLFGWSKYKVIDKSLHYCVFDYLSKDISTQDYITFLFINAYVIPFLIISFTNYKIYKITKNMLTDRRVSLHHSRLRSTQSTTSTFFSESDKERTVEDLAKLCKDNNLDRNKEFQDQLLAFDKSEKKCTKIIGCCVMTFLISWTPYAFTAVVWNMVFDYHLNSTIVLMTAVFAKCFVIWPPIIYGYLDMQFRNQTAQWMRKTFKYWLE
uniref:G_PROTEIN_RECEP_F1_2 domain-containing protein n=1 Tax=Rhabditophanes sp. KR3021 TaxID=114890 RepID=A0AC35U3F7_9BILA